MLQPTLKQTSEKTKTAGAAFPDGQLVERVRAGDTVAFELIMRRYNRRLYRLVRSIVKNHAEAEDVVQETYVRAYTRLDTFAGPNGLSGWLCRIAANEALGRLRRSERITSLDDYMGVADRESAGRRIDAMTDQQPDPERLAASSELRQLLEYAIEELPDEFRSVFVLRAVEGMSVSETAQCLAIRPETVKTRFHRSRRLLQQALGAQFDALMPSAFSFGGQNCDRIVAAVLARLESAFQAGRRQAKPSSKPRPAIYAVALPSNPNERKDS